MIQTRHLEPTIVLLGPEPGYFVVGQVISKDVGGHDFRLADRILNGLQYVPARKQAVAGLAAIAVSKEQLTVGAPHKRIDRLVRVSVAESAAITAKDVFTPINGAQWAATRFLESRTDDPTLAFPSQSSGRRSALADWITDSRNPLTARVAVNHLWARHFGKPLASDVFDFGDARVPTTAALEFAMNVPTTEKLKRNKT